MSEHPTPPPGTECPEHRGHPATAYCQVCCRPICRECRDLSSTEPRCTQCSLAEILSDVEEEWADKHHARAATKERRRQETAQRRFWRRVVLGAVALLVFMLLVGTASDTTLAGRTLYAVNLPTGSRPGLNGCLRELWRIRGGLEVYLARRGHLPNVLGDALDGETPHCPVCGTPYTYERGDAVHYTLSCPCPSCHDVTGIEVNSGSAPTVTH